MVETTTKTRLMAFKMGNEDNFDWQVVFAHSEEEAQALYARHHYYGEDASDCERCPKLDDKAKSDSPHVLDWSNIEDRALMREVGLFSEDDFYCTSCGHTEPSEDDCDCGNCADCGCDCKADAEEEPANG